jgi:predicted GNAT family N-acyltransferase
MSTVKQNHLYNANNDLDLIHPVIRPEEVRSGDPISCRIMDSKTETSIQMWSYCPFGFEFIEKQNTSNIEPGEQKKFEIVIGKTKLNVDGTIVFKKHLNPSETLYGVRINYQGNRSLNQSDEKRSQNRWNCPEHLLPSGTAPNPTRYNDYLFFKVIDISSGGLKLATSLRNKTLIVGQILETTLSIPMIGALHAAIKINRIDVETINQKDQLILGVSFIKQDTVVSSTLSEYLLTFAENCSAKSLKDAGFKGFLGSNKFDFSYTKNSKDYEDVLDLRFEAYSEDGKLTPDVDRSFMRDDFDAKSRIITVKMQGKLVATARAIFHEKGDKTSHERYLNYPENFPEIEQSLETSRLCVKPDFQGTGLARELGKHFALLTVKAGRKYVYFSAAGTLIDFWKSMGYKETGGTYVHKQLGNLEHKLIICNVYDAILGRDVSRATWQQSYSHLYDYCVEYGLVEPTTFDEIKIKTYKLISYLLGQK